MSWEIRGRTQDVHIGTFVIPVWDLVPMTIWERYIYIELCTWVGVHSDGEPIRLSTAVLAEKYRKNDKKYKENTLINYFNRSIKSLIKKGIIVQTNEKTKFNGKQIYINDEQYARKRGWFKNITMKKRKKLYTKEKTHYT